MLTSYSLEGLKAARQKKGLSRQDLATVLGVTATSYDRYENGLRRIHFDKACVLADTLAVSLDDLRHAPEDGTVVAERELAGWDIDQ